MADRSKKVQKNVEGSYFVDEQCIGCNACVVEAPDFFEMDDDTCCAYVKVQPTNSDQEKICDSAIAVCPVEAIGNK